MLLLRLVRNIILLTGYGYTTHRASPILSVAPTVYVHLMHLSAACSSTNLSLHVSSITSSFAEPPPHPCVLSHRVCLANALCTER